MPQGDKRKYTGKQKRQAEHIERGYRRRGVGKDEAERRAWATVNKIHGGGNHPGGSGHGRPADPARRGGQMGRRASKSRTSPATLSGRSSSSRKRG